MRVDYNIFSINEYFRERVTRVHEKKREKECD